MGETGMNLVKQEQKSSNTRKPAFPLFCPMEDEVHRPFKQSLQHFFFRHHYFDVLGNALKKPEIKQISGSKVAAFGNMRPWQREKLRNGIVNMVSSGFTTLEVLVEEKIIYPRAPANYWDAPELAIACIDSFIDEKMDLLKLKPREKKALQAVREYPEHATEKEREIYRKVKRKVLCSLDKNDYYEACLGALFRQKYSGSQNRLVSDLYPEYKIMPWELAHLSADYFAAKENRVKAVRWLVKKLKKNPMRLTYGDFKKNGLISLLYHIKGENKTLLAVLEAYPQKLNKVWSMKRGAKKYFCDAGAGKERRIAALREIAAAKGKETEQLTTSEIEKEVPMILSAYPARSRVFPIWEENPSIDESRLLRGARKSTVAAFKRWKELIELGAEPNVRLLKMRKNDLRMEWSAEKRKKANSRVGEICRGECARSISQDLIIGGHFFLTTKVLDFAQIKILPNSDQEQLQLTKSKDRHLSLVSKKGRKALRQYVIDSARANGHFAMVQEQAVLVFAEKGYWNDERTSWLAASLMHELRINRGVLPKWAFDAVGAGTAYANYLRLIGKHPLKEATSESLQTRRVPTSSFFKPLHP